MIKNYPRLYQLEPLQISVYVDKSSFFEYSLLSRVISSRFILVFFPNPGLEIL